MKVGFVSPPIAFCDRFLDVAQKEFQQVKVEPIIYHDFNEVAGLLEAKQDSLDVVIFAGIVAMDYAREYVPQKKLWLSLGLAGSSLFRSLLLAMRSGYDIENLSFDTYELFVLSDVFADLGYAVPEQSFRCFKGNTVSPAYLDEVFEFHVNNYKHQGVSACITGLQKVHERLSGAGIPNLIVYPVRSVMREQLNFAGQFHRATSEAKGHIIVMLVSMGYPSDYSIMLEGNDEFISEKMKIARHIYRYAGKLQAVVLEESQRDFLLLSTRDIVTLETRQFSRLSLLEWMEREVNYPVAVGIGLDDSVALAKKNAVRAMLLAKKRVRNSAYACMSDGSMVGPIVAARRAASQEENELRIDGKFLHIADKTDLSVNTVYNLHRFLARTNQDGYTSLEIAKALDYSKRYTDKLLQRLEECKYVTVSGRRILGQAGRPVRILTFHKDFY
jgi:hypothetical protein